MTRKKREQKKKELPQALEDSMGIISTACRKVGVSRQTYYDWREDQDFADRCDDAIEAAKDFVESKLYERIEAGDTTAIIFYMKTKCRDRGYNERYEISGPQDKPFEIPPGFSVLPGVAKDINEN